MKFGLFFLLEKPHGQSDSEVYRSSLEQIRAAEDLGYDYVWLAEHRFTHYGIMPDTTVFGAAAATITRRIRIGTAVVVLPFHNPIRLAEQIAMLDVISEGRYDFGVGRGYQAGEYRGFGIPMDESRSRFEEVLDICIGLWTHDRFSYEGNHYRIDDVHIEPQPVQKPHPPIWITVMRTPMSFQYAAEKGYGVISGNPYRANPEFREAFFTYREVLKGMGMEDLAKQFWALSPAFVHPDDQKAREIVLPSYDSYREAFVQYGSPAQPDGSLPKDYAVYTDWDQFRATPNEQFFDTLYYMVGSPDSVISKLRRLEQDGIENFILWMNRGGAIPQREVLRSMELFAEKVMPLFKKSQADIKSR